MLVKFIASANLKVKIYKLQYIFSFVNIAKPTNDKGP